MGSVFEAAMLVCFGFSWPLNVIKAYRARSAKGTSLAFILLIITGYVAGILAKYINGQLNYVLAVYFLNLVIVLVNLAVYFRNRALDNGRRSKIMVANKANDSVVLFGGNIDRDIPVAEIAESYDFNFKMYNRSCYSLSLKDAKKSFTEKVEPLTPEAVIIHIGAEDLDLFKKNTAEFDIKYIDLIASIKAADKNRRVALISNIDPANRHTFDEMNRHIKAIADSEHCVFVDITDARLWNPESSRELMSFMYDLGFDQPLTVKKPLGDISEILYSYAYQNGILHAVESKAM
ncbi:MAG: SGNH/GDSL hydrolase family protein [Treponema sp.]|nr:SGNH/GDSL hydrolase family protein [Treponema sp.]